MSETPTRLVPGAPPPAPLSKSQKKKRKGAKSGDISEAASPLVVSTPLGASQIETAPTATEVKEGLVAPQLTATVSVDAQSAVGDDLGYKPKGLVAPQLTATVSVDAQSAVGDDLGYKPSPVVDLVHKRLKATHKKIQRISTYASTPPEKLNEDQKRTLKTLPGLEAVQKELEEVKKAIEVHEAEQLQELAQKRAEIERVERQKVAEAAAEVQAVTEARILDLLTFLRLASLLSSGDPSISSLGLEEEEHAPIFAAHQVLLGDETDDRRSLLSGFLSGEGEHQGVPYTRLHDITRSYLNPPRAPTPTAEEIIEAAEEAIAEAEEASAGAPLSGSFRFVQDSELEGSTFEEGAEWVDRADADGGVTVEVPVIAVAEISVSASGPIDWAEDDGDNLPSIAGLHAKFGTSGTASPAEAETPTTPNGSGLPSAGPQEDDDGFTQAGRGHRGRRGHSGFRGDARGAVQFTTYEQLKKWFTLHGSHELDTPKRLAAGALAGITSVCSTYPLDLVRSRLSIATAFRTLPDSKPSKPPIPGVGPGGVKQTLASAYHTATTASSNHQPTTMWEMTLKVMREEGGVRALYRGLVATAFGVAPYVGINFAAYEALRGYITPPGKTSVTRKLACGALAVKVAPSIATSFFTYELVKDFLVDHP
ncbi:hypothetical protein HWV62_18972 [Athelia sp. TMB]|nr:hypothetical protein HWV62_18972 [Athelia sp. TMB]